jgi:hypothetical protein
VRTIGLVWALVLMLVGARPATASLPPQTEQAITQYLVELKRIEGAAGRTSLEHLFALTDTLREYLMYGELLGRWDGSHNVPTMEDITEGEYARLCDRLRGVLLNREEVVIVEADSAAFLPLARQKGLEPDRAFMDVYFRTVPVAWPSYIVQETDFSGCAEYGTGKLVALYGAWKEYRRKHPKNYARAATLQLEEIQGYLADVGNPCGGADLVERELQLFLNRFPKESIAPKVRDELSAIRAGRPLR